MLKTSGELNELIGTAKSTGSMWLIYKSPRGFTTNPYYMGECHSKEVAMRRAGLPDFVMCINNGVVMIERKAVRE